MSLIESNIGIAGSKYLEPLSNYLISIVEDFFRDNSNKKIKRAKTIEGTFLSTPIDKVFNGKRFKFTFDLDLPDESDANAYFNQDGPNITINFSLKNGYTLNKGSLYTDVNYNFARVSTSIKHEAAHLIKYVLGYDYTNHVKSHNKAQDLSDGPTDLYYMSGDEREVNLINVFAQLKTFMDLYGRFDMNISLTKALKQSEKFSHIRELFVINNKFKSVKHERIFKKMLSKIVEWWKRNYPNNPIK